MNSQENKPIRLVTAEEQDMISRNVLVWLSTFPEIPEEVRAGNPLAPINFEFLAPNTPGMTLSTIQAPYKLREYITGGYYAEYQFKVIYRIVPGITSSPNKRLTADELLDRLGDWMSRSAPDLGSGITSIRVESTTRSSLFGIYENGDEDHQILAKLNYEVI